jgi:hypothetical protein
MLALRSRPDIGIGPDRVSENYEGAEPATLEPVVERG